MTTTRSVWANTGMLAPASCSTALICASGVEMRPAAKRHPGRKTQYNRHRNTRSGDRSLRKLRALDRDRPQARHDAAPARRTFAAGAVFHRKSHRRGLAAGSRNPFDRERTESGVPRIARRYTWRARCQRGMAASFQLTCPDFAMGIHYAAYLIGFGGYRDETISSDFSPLPNFLNRVAENQMTGEPPFVAGSQEEPRNRRTSPKDVQSFSVTRADRAARTGKKKTSSLDGRLARTFSVSQTPEVRGTIDSNRADRLLRTPRGSPRIGYLRRADQQEDSLVQRLAPSALRKSPPFSRDDGWLR